MKLWSDYRERSSHVQAFQWTGDEWNAIKGWGTPIKSTGEHIARRELEVWDKKLGVWVIAKISDYVIQSLEERKDGSGKGWYYCVVSEDRFQELYEEAPSPWAKYKPPGVYC